MIIKCKTCSRIINSEERCIECGEFHCEKTCLQDHGLKHLLINSNDKPPIPVKDKKEARSSELISKVESGQTITNPLMNKGSMKNLVLSKYSYKDFEIIKFSSKNQLKELVLMVMFFYVKISKTQKSMLLR